MMKPRSSYSKTAFILLFSVFLVAAVTKAKSSLPDITLEQAKEMNADNTVIFLFRHGERCDRSDMPCYSDKSGITITGTEKAQQEGIKFATIFSEYDIYSSNAVRTIQTAKFFSGKEPVVMDSLSDCNNDLYKTLESIARESHKRNIVLMNPLMILVKIIKLRWIHILSYDQMVSRKINNQTTRCANSIFYTTLFTNSAPNYT
ncbi:lipopolysaccharide core heptose(II)-phosphate phosphatase [Salmonella enterica]|nr:lipopolysaccharide core heptose(II)-phosphate phosphatase [Salmonella enterica]